jgi:hypothetical protein
LAVLILLEGCDAIVDDGVLEQVLRRVSSGFKTAGEGEEHHPLGEGQGMGAHEQRGGLTWMKADCDELGMSPLT